MESKIDQLSESLKTGFIDKEILSLRDLRPELVVNDSSANKKVLTTLEKELLLCSEFWFSVAFVTTSGVASIINSLLLLETRGVKGKILTSQYLNFTHPEALKRLLSFKNIELKIAVDTDFHSKGYLFKKNDLYSLIIGSSNLTASALSENKEWNLKISATEKSDIIGITVQEFQKEFSAGKTVDSNFIAEYEKVYKKQYEYYKELNEKRKLSGLDIPQPNKMQIEALSNIAKLRDRGANKALLISATGTGKTFLSAFDVKRVNPKRFLFIVHRTNIAQAALNSFQKVFGPEKKMALFSGSSKDPSVEYLFATILTISRPENLVLFSPTEFDYIVIDETHRAGASSYQKIIEYFKPQYLLGMSATPERTDGYDIYSLFNNNIAYEIRLHQALEEKILSPFHYYGITDILIDGNPIDDTTKFSTLISSQRVNHIIEKSKLYGCDNGKIKGLVFCSRTAECQELSREFNARGFNTIYLSGESSETEREEAIEQLENEQLQYIFTVDIFNEGVDIPSVNQIILLRPTKSAIIFVQQLGRGLRKAENKQYLTVIDFIGNYANDYLVPIALFGDTSYNKDTLRKLMTSGSAIIPGTSTVHFDEISKKRIFKAIDRSNLKRFVDLKNDYLLLKYKLGKSPSMVDFLDHGSRDPWSYVETKGSYYSFVASIEKDFDTLSQQESQLLSYFSKEINNSKRLEDSLLLWVLIESYSVTFGRLKAEVFSRFGYTPSDDTILSAISNLNFDFITTDANKIKVRVSETIGFRLINQEGELITLSSEFESLLNNKVFRQYLLDSTQYSILTFKRSFDRSRFFNGFILYNKYSRKDVFRVLNWDKNPVAQNVGGYMVSADKKDCAIFVTYHKSDDIADTTKYPDKFISPSVFLWASKSKRTLKSPDVLAILDEKNNIRLPLFIKKSDDEGTDFYYIGELSPLVEHVKESTLPLDSGGTAPVVLIQFKINPAVDDSIYEYLTTEV